MTHLKKSLAMLLALIMMFSSMSVAASAWDGSEDPSDITFTVKFFREDPKNPGSWIETEKAKPNEELRARVYIKTGFSTFGGDMCFLFDNQYFSVSDYYNSGQTELTVNSKYAGYAEDDYGAGDYALAAKATYPWNGDDSKWGKDIDYILSDIEKDENFFNTRDILSNNILYGSGVNNSPFDDSDWMFEYKIKVNDNDITNTVDTEGEGKIPPYYNSADGSARLFVNMPKGEYGKYRNETTIPMRYWVPDFATNPGVVTTTSEIIFDMGLVDENGDWKENTYTTEKGIIGKEANFDVIANPTNPDGRVFDYWSDQKPAEGVTQAKVSVISYDYDVQTLYAVWKEPSDVSYTLKEFYMDADGNYPDDVEGTSQAAKPGSKVSAEAPEDERFTLDMENSDFDVVVKADGSSVVNAYYIRNKYNLIYHYEDLAGAQTDTYPVRFGAKLPAFDATPSGEPTKTGYTFLGWTTTKDGTTVETLPDVMPAEELHLYPVYAPGETYDAEFIFNAGEGTFSDGTNVKRYAYKYFDEVITPEEPTAVGKKFVDWDDDVPEIVDGNRTFNALYEDELYTVTFKADKDEDGEYESTVAVLEEAFAYGEKLYTEFAPENYPADVWELEDGTKVVFSDDDKAAYTVTGDVTLYTVGADKYPARFYWSQEDLDNGAEPYETVYVTYEESITAPTAPQKAGYTFIQWIPDVESGLIMDSTDGKDFVAVFEAKEIKVTFDPNGGTCDVASDSATYGESIKKLPEASKDGYEFLGWYTPDGNLAGMDGDSYAVPAEDIILTAKWEAENHTIFFVEEDGSEIGKIEAKTDSDVVVPDNLNPPTKTGYQFVKWVDEDGKDAIVPEVMPAEDVTLTAKWAEIFDVTYYNEDGTEFKKYTDAGLEGAAVPVPAEKPEKDGHYFAGWVDKDGNAVTVIPNGDVKLYPKFEKNPTYSITYMDGGKVVNTVSYEKDAEIADYKLDNQEGKTFKGWNPSLPEKMPAENLTVNAVWETNKNSVTLNAGEGKFDDGKSVFTGTFEYGTDLTDKLPADPEREGYEFKGWEDAKGNVVDLPATMPDEAVNLTAKWEVKEYTITFDTDGGNDIAAKKYDFGATIGELPVPVKDNSKFTGWIWTNEKGEVIDACTTMPAHNITVKATWDLNKNTITLDAGEGKFDDGKSEFSETFEYGTDLTDKLPADPEREGYEFKGWEDAKGNIVDLPATMPGEDVNLTAKWEVKEYTITFDTDGGDAIESKTYDFGATIGELPVPVKDKSQFAGWVWTNEKGEIIDACETMPAHNITVKATWTVPTYSIEYYLAVDGTLYKSLSFEEGKTIVHPDDPTIEGLTFKGWVDEDGNALPEDMVMGAENIKVYAKFDVNSYKVTYIVDGEVYEEYDVLYQSEVPVPEDPADSATRIFAGWSPAPESVMPARDLTYTATWADPEPDKFTATFLRADGKTHSKVVLAEGDAIPVPEAPKKFGYKFVGWEPEVPATMPAEDMVFEPQYEIDKNFVTLVVGGTVVAGGVIAGSIIGAGVITGISIVGGVIVLVGVAELIKHTHTVTYIVDGEVYKTYKVVEGTKIPVPADPAKDGFIFEGWNPEVPEKMGKEDLVFEATWTEKAADDSADVDVNIPETGSVAGGLAAFAVISGAAAAAYVITRKKKED